MISGGEFAASYRATLANIILWAVFHIAMFIHIVLSVQWYERKSAETLNPTQVEKAKAALELIRRNIALGKQVKRAPTQDEVDQYVADAGRTWRAKTLGEKRLRQKRPQLFSNANRVGADLLAPESKSNRNDSMAGVKHRSASFIFSRAQRKVAEQKGSKSKSDLKACRSKTATDIEPFDVLDSDVEIVSYFSNPIITAESSMSNIMTSDTESLVIVPGANGTAAAASIMINGDGGSTGGSFKRSSSPSRQSPTLGGSDSETEAGALLSELQQDDDSYNAKTTPRGLVEPPC